MYLNRWRPLQINRTGALSPGVPVPAAGLLALLLAVGAVVVPLPPAISADAYVWTLAAPCRRTAEFP